MRSLLARRGELGGGAERRGLGLLASGVGVHLGVEHEDVDVAAGGQHVVEAAVADVVGPSVAADDPDALLDEVVGEETQPHRFRIGPPREQELQVRDPLPLRGDSGLPGLVGGEETLDEIPG